MNKNLVLITGNFPFSKTETFLETEIIELAKHFENILILPSDISGDRRVLPEKVKVDETFATAFKNKSGKVKSLFSITFLIGLMCHFKYLHSLTAIRRINSYVADWINTERWLEEKCPFESAVVYTYWLNGKTHGAAQFCKKRSSFRIVSRTHRYDLYDYWFTPPFWPFRQQLLDILDKLYFISSDGYDYLTEKYRIPENRIEIARLGVYNPKNITPKSKDGKIRIVSVSGIIPMKRIDLLASLLCQYATEYPEEEIIWTHMGDGYMKEIVLDFLKEKASKNLIYQFKGQVDNKAVFDFFRSHEIDLFINVSESEGLPVSIMEAQSNGIFVAATDVGGVKEIVNNRVGYLMPKDLDFEIFCKMIQELKNNNSVQPEEVKAFWKETYDADTNYKRFAKNLVNLD